MKNNSLESSQRRTMIITYAALIIGALIMVFPFIWMILTSFKTVAESNAVPPVIFPKAFRWENFKEAVPAFRSSSCTSTPP